MRSMLSADRVQRTPPRRVRVWKIVLVAVVLAAVVEPLVMYRVLVAQREQRQEAAALVMPAVARQAAAQ
ncbi:MAG TPA: hypothetical protein VMQ10_11710 [Spirochaetia bacterium]|nr:hypothetical protein [Spirochaetia bacterium]